VVQRKLLLETRDSFVVNSDFCEPPCTVINFLNYKIENLRRRFFFFLPKIVLDLIRNPSKIIYCEEPSFTALALVKTKHKQKKNKKKKKQNSWFFSAVLFHLILKRAAFSLPIVRSAKFFYHNLQNIITERKSRWANNNLDKSNSQTKRMLLSLSRACK